MRIRFCATTRRPAFSIMALMAPVRLRSVASGLRIEKVRSIAIGSSFTGTNRRNQGVSLEEIGRAAYTGGCFGRQGRPTRTFAGTQGARHADPLYDVRRLQRMVQRAAI